MNHHSSPYQKDNNKKHTVYFGFGLEQFNQKYARVIIDKENKQLQLLSGKYNTTSQETIPFDDILSAYRGHSNRKDTQRYGDHQNITITYKLNGGENEIVLFKPFNHFLKYVLIYFTSPVSIPLIFAIMIIKSFRGVPTTKLANFEKFYSTLLYSIADSRKLENPNSKNLSNIEIMALFKKNYNSAHSIYVSYGIDSLHEKPSRILFDSASQNLFFFTDESRPKVKASLSIDKIISIDLGGPDSPISKKGSREDYDNISIIYKVDDSEKEILFASKYHRNSYFKEFYDELVPYVRELQTVNEQDFTVL